MSALLALVWLLVLALDLAATLVLLRSPLYDARQKRLQLALVWLLPLLGALLVLYLAREPRSRRRSTDYPADGGCDDGDLRLENYSGGDCAGSDAGGGDGGGGGGD